MVRWLVFLRVIGVFATLFVDFTSVLTAFAPRREQEINGVRSFSVLSGSNHGVIDLPLSRMTSFGTPVVDKARMLSGLLDFIYHEYQPGSNLSLTVT